MEDAIPSIEDAVHRKGSYIDLAYETGIASNNSFSANNLNSVS